MAVVIGEEEGEGEEQDEGGEEGEEANLLSCVCLRVGPPAATTHMDKQNNNIYTHEDTMFCA